jgi:hypothetical protein
MSLAVVTCGLLSAALLLGGGARAEAQQDVSVDVAVRVLQVSKSTLKEIARDFQELGVRGEVDNLSRQGKVAAFLNDAQVYGLLVLAQEDRRTSTLQFPGLRVRSGQEAVVDIRRNLVEGWHLAVRPTATADLRYVSLDVTTCQTIAASAPVWLGPGPTDPVSEKAHNGGGPAARKLAVRRQVMVPSESTVVLCGGRVSGEEGPEYRFLLVRPRVKVQPVKEVLFQGGSEE